MRGRQVSSCQDYPDGIPKEPDLGFVLHLKNVWLNSQTLVAIEPKILVQINFD